MRVGLVTYALGVGGVETFLRQLASQLQTRGHTVTVYETLRRGHGGEAFLRAGIVLSDASARFWETRVGHAARLGRLLSGHDAVILNDAPFAQAALGLIGERTAVVPVVHMPVGSMVRTATACATDWDLLVAVSPSGSEAVCREGIDPGRVVCIPNGVDVPRASEGAARSGLQNGPLRAIFIGRVEHRQKGVLHLPGIVRRAGERVPGFRLDVVGEGPDLAELRALAAGQCPGAAVRFHGALRHETAMALLSKSHVLLMPSNFEGLPLVLLEAMARGVVPVVSRLRGSTDFVVTDGSDGTLIDPSDEDAFARSVTAIAGDRGLFERCSAAARETVRKRFSVEAAAASYIDHVQRCARMRAAGGAPRRSGRIEFGLLGDFPSLPVPFVRPARTFARLLGAR